jgi:Na+-driven multidrug efflux pump
VGERWNNRALFHLILPLIIEQILSVAMGATDTLMASSVGEFATSAVNIIDNINNLFIIAFGALSTGGAVVISQYLGSKDEKNSRTASMQLLYSVVVASIIIMIIAIIFRRSIINLIYGSIEGDVMNAASKYFLFTALSYPAMALYSACTAL